MPKLNAFIIGSLLAIALFIICNCAGYLLLTLAGPLITGSEENLVGLPENGASPGVVAFVTPTATPIGLTLAEPSSTPVGPVAAVTPIPLLPTVTPTPLPSPETIPPAASPTALAALATATATGTSTSTPTASPTPSPRSRPAGSSQVTTDLAVLSHQNYVDSLGWYHIVGEVENRAGVPVEYVEVMAKLYNADETVIGTKLTFTAPDIIFPGGKAPFDLVVLRQAQWEQVERYTLHVKADTSESLLPEHLVLLNQSSRIEEDYLYVEGEVQNQGDTPALVKLIVTLYDADYNVINTDWSYADSGIISPGSNSAFEVKVGHQTDPDNYHYRIQIQEEPLR